MGIATVLGIGIVDPLVLTIKNQAGLIVEGIQTLSGKNKKKVEAAAK